MDYQTILAEQAIREQRIFAITHGQATDNEHIAECIRVATSEPDDLVRVTARLWLEHHALDIANRLISK